MKSVILVATLMAAITRVAADPIQSFVEAPGPMGALKGTLLAAETRGAPVVLIIPGSGPVDRDGNGAGFKAAMYRLLAEGLANRGVTSVRIDKRGMFESKAALPDGNGVTVADYGDDVHAWIKVLRQKTGAECVWVLGHSEGGLVALVAAKGASDICGLVLVATPGRPLGEVLRDQLKANFADQPILGEALRAIDALEAGKRVDTSKMPPILLSLFRPQVQGFLINAFSYDPAKLLQGYDHPVLIMQGQSDIQVSEGDALLLKDADERAHLALLSDVNHVLKYAPPLNRATNIATYINPSLPLAPGVVEMIAEFLIHESKRQ